jgi:molybdopterin-guanine dinucleotide biosynthesis protein A
LASASSFVDPIAIIDRLLALLFYLFIYFQKGDPSPPFALRSRSAAPDSEARLAQRARRGRQTLERKKANSGAGRIDVGPISP